MLCLEHCFLWLGDLNTKEIVAEVVGELEDNRQGKMVGESN